MSAWWSRDTWQLIMCILSAGTAGVVWDPLTAGNSVSMYTYRLPYCYIYHHAFNEAHGKIAVIIHKALTKHPTRTEEELQRCRYQIYRNKCTLALIAIVMLACFSTNSMGIKSRNHLPTAKPCRQILCKHQPCPPVASNNMWAATNSGRFHPYTSWPPCSTQSWLS